MRRRLWWSLVLFDTRVNELANSKTITLNPTWDCKTPLNINDSDLRPETKGLPAIQGRSSDALFTVVRCELGEFIRHTAFYLDFTSPVLKPIAKCAQKGPPSEGGEVDKLERMIEDKYLKFCDEDNPIHFMTVWTARAYLAKGRLLEYHSRYFNPSVRQPEAQRDAATSHALRALECDTKIMTSPLTKGFRWLNHFYFPFPAYMQALQDLRRRPINERSRQAWEVMSDNYEAWFDSELGAESPVFQMFSRIVLQAWEACETALSQSGETFTPPRMVTSIRHTLAQGAGHRQNTDTEQSDMTMDVGIDNYPMLLPTNYGSQSRPYNAVNTVMQGGYPSMEPGTYTGEPGQAPLDDYVNQLDWVALGGWPGLGGY